MSTIINSKEQEQAFFDGKHLIGIRYPLHFSDFITQVYHQMALSFVNNGEPITYEKPVNKKQSNTGLFDTDTLTERQFHQVFRADDHVDRTEHILYENRVSTHYLLSSPEKFDYIWMVSDINAPEEYCADLIRKINQIPDVQISTVMDTNKQKDLSYLIL